RECEDLYGAASLRHCESLRNSSGRFIYGNECELNTWIAEAHTIPGTHSDALRHALAVDECAAAAVIEQQELVAFRCQCAMAPGNASEAIRQRDRTRPRRQSADHERV